MMSEGVVRYVRNPDFIFRKVVDEAILVPLKQNVADMDAIFSLNEVGAFVWDQLVDAKTLTDLKAAVFSEFDEKPETIEKDLASFLGSLEEIGAIMLGDE